MSTSTSTSTSRSRSRRSKQNISDSSEIMWLSSTGLFCDGRHGVIDFFVGGIDFGKFIVDLVETIAIIGVAVVGDLVVVGDVVSVIDCSGVD